MKWEEFLQSLLDYQVLNIRVVRLGTACVILLLFLALRQLFVKLIVSLLKKLAAKTRTELDDQIVDVVEVPIRFLIIIWGIWIAAHVLILSKNAENFMQRTVYSMLQFTIYWAAYRAVDTIVAFFQKIYHRSETKLDNMLVPFIRTGLKILVIVLGSASILSNWVDNLTGLVTGLGLGGLAFALAAKDAAANLLGSITIMLDRPFAIGDWVLTSHVEGTVEDMGFRSTRIRTFAQALVTIPNSVLSNEPITNWSRMGKRRMSYRLGLSYMTKASQLREFLQRLRETLQNHPEVHPQTIVVNFERFSESSLDILIYLFTRTTGWQEFMQAQEDINLKIMDLLEEMNLTVAFPSRSVYIEMNNAKPLDQEVLSK